MVSSASFREVSSGLGTIRARWVPLEVELVL